MTLGLQGKIALVTAASDGLGFACAERLAKEGCALAICGRTQATLESARERLSRAGARDILAVSVDISKASAVEAFITKVLGHFGHIDVLVVNSGHIDYGGLEDLTDAQWDNAYNLLLMSVVRLVRHCVPAMRANKGGDIVILGSATVREPPPHLLLSTVMRLGVVGLAKTLARSLAPDNIRVNIVAPGYFDTGRVHKRVEALMKEKNLSEAQAQAQVSGGLPMGRIGAAEELAELVAFVASRKAGFMTGSTIAIDGGGSRALF
jgi:3-oxoacyl-[acyl-carrier protein] reductase